MLWGCKHDFYLMIFFSNMGHFWVKLLLSKRGWVQNFFCQNEFYLHENKMRYHINGFALCLTLKQRLGATRKWPITLICLTLGIIDKMKSRKINSRRIFAFLLLFLIIKNKFIITLLRATRGACNPSLQVAITHALCAANFFRTSTKKEWNASNINVVTRVTAWTFYLS